VRIHAKAESAQVKHYIPAVLQGQRAITIPSQPFLVPEFQLTKKAPLYNEVGVAIII
jgi:hypothetical protein